MEVIEGVGWSLPAHAVRGFNPIHQATAIEGHGREGSECRMHSVLGVEEAAMGAEAHQPSEQGLSKAESPRHVRRKLRGKLLLVTD